jgi:hypothetical protein
MLNSIGRRPSSRRRILEARSRDINVSRYISGRHDIGAPLQPQCLLPRPDRKQWRRPLAGPSVPPFQQTPVPRSSSASPVMRLKRVCSSSYYSLCCCPRIRGHRVMKTVDAVDMVPLSAPATKLCLRVQTSWQTTRREIFAKNDFIGLDKRRGEVGTMHCQRKYIQCRRQAGLTPNARPASSSIGACGHAISTIQPAPGRMVNRNPCSFAIAATRFRPRPRPDVCLILSDR